MSFSQDVKREIQEHLSKKSNGFTFSQNANNINQIDRQLKVMDLHKGSAGAESINTADVLAYLFVQKGSVNDPNISYHLEIVCDSSHDAEAVANLMADQGFKVRTTGRKGKYIVYLKDRESIADFLGYIGAVSSMMAMENSLILKDVRNSVNRKVNFEAANIERTVGAAMKDIEDIRYIESHGGLKQLPAGLRDMAEMRIEYPDATLQSLGDNMDPPLGKSGVNHRLRKIREFAERLRYRK